MGKTVKILLILSIITLSKAYSCSCIGKVTIEQSYLEANAIFTGKVLSIQKEERIIGDFTYQEFVIEIKIKKVFKGKIIEQIKVVTGLGGGDCGFPFKTGKSYLVYAYKLADSERIETDICQRTSLKFGTWQERLKLNKIKNKL